MTQFLISGNQTISGKITVSGSKNSALPILAASTLANSKMTIKRIPYINDILSMLQLLIYLGYNVSLDGNQGDFHRGKIINITPTSLISNFPDIPLNIATKMRASILLLGPILAKYKKIRIPLPGGCTIGTRPIDFHIKALKDMGADIHLYDRYIEASVSSVLRGTRINLPLPSVGTTENILMTATLAKGKTIICNAAFEPEVIDLINCLKTMGAEISYNVEERVIEIIGQEELEGCTYEVMGDRIEAGTYAISAAATGGNIDIEDIDPKIIIHLIEFLKKSGSKVSIYDNGFNVNNNSRTMEPVDITTGPYPDFSTDLQSLAMTMLITANGKSVITESMFENRFMNVPELIKMGAKISLDKNRAIIEGVPKIHAASIESKDLRSSVSLLIAGFMAEGNTILTDSGHIDRGYENLYEKYRNCGAQFERHIDGEHIC